MYFFPNSTLLFSFFAAQANEWDFDSASALNRFDHHGYSRSNLMEQFLKERQKQEQAENFDYDLKFLPYSAQARFTRFVK